MESILKVSKHATCPRDAEGSKQQERYNTKNKTKKLTSKVRASTPMPKQVPLRILAHVRFAPLRPLPPLLLTLSLNLEDTLHLHFIIRMRRTMRIKRVPLKSTEFHRAIDQRDDAAELERGQVGVYWVDPGACRRR